MVKLKIEYSSKKNLQRRGYVQCVEDGDLFFSIFDDRVNAGEFANERDFRAQLLSDFVSEGFRVWKIQKRKKG